MRILEALVSVLAIQASVATGDKAILDEKVERSVRAPLAEFAAISHTLGYPDIADVCFERDGLFSYSVRTCDIDFRSDYSLEAIPDEFSDENDCEALQSRHGQDLSVTLFRPKCGLVSISDHAECLLLKEQIIRSHVDLALKGELSDKSAYGPHYAVICKEDECNAFGDLATISKLSKSMREHLSKETVKICPFVGSKKTAISSGFYQNLSATVFGRVPEKINDICFKLFASFTQMEPRILEVMQEIMNR